MTSRGVGLLLGSASVLVAAIWCWAVIETIPGAAGEGRLGPRGFPLGMGAILGVLGLTAIAHSLFERRSGEETKFSKGEIRAAVSTFGLLVGYGALLQYTGFVIGTTALVAVAVGPVLGVWSWKIIVGMAVCLSIGLYLVLNVLLGVYLPVGKLVNIALPV